MGQEDFESYDDLVHKSYFAEASIRNMNKEQDFAYEKNRNWEV